jgi:hypothetical protein
MISNWPGDRTTYDGSSEPKRFGLAEWASVEAGGVEAFAAELVTTLTGSMKSGLAVERASACNRAFRSSPAHAQGDRREIAGLTVAWVFADLDAGLAIGSLKAYEGCLRSLALKMCWLRVSRIHSAWLREEQAGLAPKNRALSEAVQTSDPACFDHRTPERVIVARDTLRRLLSVLAPRQQSIILRSACGFTQVETGSYLGVDQATVSRERKTALHKIRADPHYHSLRN